MLSGIIEPAILCRSRIEMTRIGNLHLTNRTGQQMHLRTLYRELEGGAFASGGEWYVRASHAKRFLDSLRSASVAVLGIEGVRGENDHVIHQLDSIADFSDLTAESWPTYVDRTITAAERFLSLPDISPCDAFTFVVLEECDWQKAPPKD